MFEQPISEISETASDAWSTDVLASDTEEKHSELLKDLEQVSCLSVTPYDWQAFTSFFTWADCHGWLTFSCWHLLFLVLISSVCFLFVGLHLFVVICCFSFFFGLCPLVACCLFLYAFPVIPTLAALRFPLGLVINLPDHTFFFLCSHLVDYTANFDPMMKSQQMFYSFFLVPNRKSHQ